MTAKLLVEPLNHVRRLHVLVMLRRKPVKAQRLVDVLLHPCAQLPVPALPLLKPRRQVPARLLQVATVVQPPQLLQAIVVRLARQVVKRVAQKMHVAALPDRFREHFGDARPKTRVVVAHHELHAPQAPGLQALQKLAPARHALPVRQLHPENAPAAVLVDADGHQHRLTAHHPVLPHPLVPRVQHQVRVRLLQAALAEFLQFLVQPDGHSAHRRRREGVPAQGLRHLLHLARRHPLNVHLNQRVHQRLLAALVALEHLRREKSLAILRNTQLNRSDPRHQIARVVPASIPLAPVRTRALLRAKAFRHLRLKRLLDRFPDHLTKEIFVSSKQRFPILARLATITLGHDVSLWGRRPRL